MSRAFGDTIAASVGVVSTPEVNHYEVEPEDLFVLVCSDGVWEFISDDEAIGIIAKEGTNVKRATERLAALAWQRWITNEEDVVDDITVIVAYLPK